MNNYYYKNYGNINIVISYRNNKFYNENDMSDNYKENINNRLHFFKQLNIEEKIILHPKQIHSNIIENATKDKIECDGLYTNDNNKALYILTADCFNIFYFNKNEFGVVHAGWKSIEKGIIENLRSRIQSDYHIIIAQGICKKHFKVNKDVADKFYSKYSSEYIKKKDNCFLIDLRGIINSILKENKNIENINLCNICNNNKLFSFRYENTKYRNMSIIWRSHL